MDLANRTVLEFREVTDRQYMWAPMDLAALSEIKEHPEMLSAFEARGIKDLSKVECRASRDLVLRMIMGAGNYDYLFDWVFMQSGVIRVNLAATGIDQMKSVKARSAAEDSGGAADRYGRFVAPHLVAVNHGHLFNFRFDFDVDGQNNSLLVDRLVTERQGADNPRRSVWRVETEVAKREKDAMRTSSLTAPEQWRVVNPSRIVPPATPAATWSRDTAS